MTETNGRRWSTALILTALLASFAAGCAPSGGSDQPGPTPLPPVPEQNPTPVKQETSCENLVGVPKGQLIAPTEAIRRGRAFLVRSFATFMGATSPNEARHFIGIKGTLYPALSALNSSSLVFNVLCSDNQKKTNGAGGSVVVTSITPRPEVRILNNNEFQTFMALAPESIWGDGTLDGSLIPSLEWIYGSGWRVTLTASRQSVRTDLFVFKRSREGVVPGGKGTFEIYEGKTRDTFIVVYTIDAIVSGKAVRVRNELEYVAL